MEAILPLPGKKSGSVSPHRSARFVRELGDARASSTLRGSPIPKWLRRRIQVRQGGLSPKSDVWRESPMTMSYPI
ncbi:MAG TPA: hypothetical protein VHQ68_03700, partial [Propionibacteriaceae bacterium]|nr:hypothetical protein [Propionibacteriaceae bacterium]